MSHGGNYAGGEFAATPSMLINNNLITAVGVFVTDQM